MPEALTLQIIMAFSIDLILGDPHSLPHPIRAIGRAIEGGERILRILPWQRPAGLILTFLIVSGTYLAVYWVLSISFSLNFILYFILSIIILYYTISVKALGDEAGRVASALEAGDIDGARRSLSGIVGRDTHNLDQGQIVKACVETVAENTVDGIISPLFYAFLGGPALAMAYKAVSTLDSMVGYRNERYIRFGWASARLDDLANYVPARLSARLIPVSSYLCGERFKDSFYVAIRDGRKHPSPNSGIPEAAFAGALGVQLGGPITYRGLLSNKPLIGDPREPLKVEVIERSVRLAYTTALLALGLGVIVRTLVFSL